MYRMLLVDDEYMILAGLKKLIPWEQLNIEIIGTAKNGQEALTFVRENEVDLVITDITMPVLSGVEFVRRAQEENIHFRFMVLSGYQEFNYVKESLKLGAENYLVKPIDKDELFETLKKCLSELDEENEKFQSQTLLFEYLLKRWVHGDIDYVDLKKNMAKFNYSLQDQPYTVFVFDYVEELDNEVISCLKEFGQELYYHNYEEKKWVLIFVGNEQEVINFSNYLQHKLVQKQGFMGIGETVTKVDEVSLSYTHAMDSSQLSRFYRELNSIPLSQEVHKLPKLSFLEFNQALAIRDFVAIKNEIDKILNKLQEQSVKPEYSKHVIFLIFMDLYRNFDNVIESFYQQSLEIIATESSYDVLKQLIDRTLCKINNEEGSRRVYSHNVQEALKIVHDDYQEDLSLKFVADRLHISAMYLGQIFKKETTKNFSQYLNEYRIKRAQDLLISTGLNVNEISEKIGYTSTGYFYKNFKKICGISPKEFRERYLNNYNPV